jgi:hypothetical protein
VLRRHAPIAAVEGQMRSPRGDDVPWMPRTRKDPETITGQARGPADEATRIVAELSHDLFY